MYLPNVIFGPRTKEAAILQTICLTTYKLCIRLFKCVRFSCPTDLMQYSLHVFVATDATRKMHKITNDRSKSLSFAFLSAVVRLPMNAPIPAKQPPTPTLDRMPKNKVKKLLKLLHCIGLFTMNRTTGQTAGGAGGSGLKGSCSRWGLSARRFSWSNPAAEVFCTADISVDVPAAIGWTSSLELV
jgi:hypothetical protein